MKGSILGIVRIWREVRSGNRSITITRALMYSILSQIKEFKKIFKWISGFLVYIRIYIRSSSSPFFLDQFSILDVLLEFVYISKYTLFITIDRYLLLLLSLLLPVLSIIPFYFLSILQCQRTLSHCLQQYEGR